MGGLRPLEERFALGWRQWKSELGMLKIKGQRNVKSEKIEGVLALHTFPPSQFLSFFPLGGRRSAVFWRVKSERIILNFYCLILNSKLKIQNYQLNQSTKSTISTL